MIYYFYFFQVPITIDVEVPNELHRLLSGQKRRELMQTYDVHILLPLNDDPSDFVKVRRYSTYLYFMSIPYQYL